MKLQLLVSRSVRQLEGQVLAVAGGMAERFKAHAWKACWGESPSGVRIPVPPPYPLTSGHLYAEDIPCLSLYSWDNPGIKDISSPLASSPVHGIMWGQMWGWIFCQVKCTS